MFTARYSHPIAAALLAGVAAVASACSSETPGTDANSSTRTSASAPASTNASTSTPSAEALAAYRAMWAEVASAGTTADYQAPSLSEHLSGDALKTITENLAADKNQGIVGRGVPVVHPVVTAASTTSVALSDCLDDRAWLQVYASTGKPVDDVPGGLRSTTATVTDINGTWKVTQLNTGDEGSCTLTPQSG